MDSQRVTALLDKSCGIALDDWAQAHGQEIDGNEANEAMKSLEGDLRRCVKPNFGDPYIPPAYVVNYQLGHVYMAREAFSRIVEMLEKRSRHSLRIVDLGSGTSAGLIGATLMVAEAIEDGRTFEHIHYDEIDTSASMQAMGGLVWEAFTRRVQREFASTALADAVKVIEPKQHGDWRNVEGDGGETWLAAFHVIYPENTYLKNVVDMLYRRVNPIAGVFSCHKGNVEKMREVFPFRTAKEWNEGKFPPRKVGDRRGSICKTDYIIKRAVHYGFRLEGERFWKPFLQVKDCAVLFGNR